MRHSGSGKRKVLGLTLDSTWSIKDYILSGAVGALNEDFSVVAWVPADRVEGTKQLLARASAGAVAVRPFIPFTPSAAFTAVCKVQKSIRFERYDVDTEKVLRRRSPGTVVRSRGPLVNGLSAIARVVAKSPAAGPIEPMLARLRSRCVPDLYGPEFDDAAIDVVMTTDPTKRDEDPIYFEAKRRKLPATTLVLSWDHLTNKGIIHGSFSHVMVWNQIMRDEMALMYPWYPPDRISIVGFPRFDVYGRPFPARYERGEFLSSLGLDPARPVLLYASSASKGFRVQNQVLEHICRAIAEGEVGRGVQLLIRCHPHDDVEEVKGFRGRRDVAVWPGEERATSGTIFERLPDADELLILGASVKHAAAVVGVGSTVMLDAARCDVPIICIAYDGDTVVPPDDSVASVYGYSHQKPLHQLGATDICYSRAELLASIRRALQEPGRQAAGRRALVSRYLGGYDSSIERIRGVLRSVVNGAS